MNAQAQIQPVVLFEMLEEHQTEGFREGPRAFVEKCEPVWAGG